MDNVKINSKQQVVNFFMKDLEVKYPNAFSLYRAMILESKRVYVGVIENAQDPKQTFIAMDIAGSGDMIAFKPIASFGAEVMFEIDPNHFDVTVFKSTIEQCLHNCLPAIIDTEPLVAANQSQVLNKDIVTSSTTSQPNGVFSTLLHLPSLTLDSRGAKNLKANQSGNTIHLQGHYNNENGSLYKIQQQRNWNSYLFDVVKRLERFDKKDQPIVEILKSIGVLALQIQEQDLFIGDSHEQLINKTLIALHKVLHPQLIVFTQQELDTYIESAIKAYEDGKKVAQSYQGGN